MSAAPSVSDFFPPITHMTARRSRERPAMPRPRFGRGQASRCVFWARTRPDQAALLARAYMKAHLLLLPSRAGFTPMVAAKAMAYRTLVVASDVGGLGTMLGGPGTGRLLPLSTKAAD